MKTRKQTHSWKRLIKSLDLFSKDFMFIYFKMN